MFDIALADTGDWLFTANRDIAGASGENVTRQRMITRLRIPRGVIRSNPIMGSRLHEAHSYSESRAVREIPALVQDALAPMTDINVIEVEVVPRTAELPLQVRVEYAPSVATPDDLTSENSFNETFRF